MGQLLLLNVTECFGRGGVAGQDYQPTASLKEGFNAAFGELENGFERTGTIGAARVIAEVYVVVPGQFFQECPQYGKTAKSGIENAYHQSVGFGFFSQQKEAGHILSPASFRNHPVCVDSGYFVIPSFFLTGSIMSTAVAA